MIDDLKASLILRWALVAFLGFCIAPFLILTLFAHPSGDDWYLAADCRSLGYWEANVRFYTLITGRFVSTALLYLHPILISFAFYKVVCAAVVAAFVPAMYAAVRAWFPETTANWRWFLSFAGTAVFLWAMPSPAQGLYWATGFAIYTIAGILSICLAAVLGRRCLAVEYKPSAAVIVAAGLLAFAIVGCTEVGMALLLLHLIVLNAFFVWRHRRVSPLLAATLGFAALAAVAVILAPGNAHRTAWYSNKVQHQLSPALLMAAKAAVRQAAAWLSFSPVFLLSLFALAWWPAVKVVSRRQAWELVALALILLVGTVWGGFFIGAWSTGKILPPRSINLLCLFFLMDWLVLLAAASLWIRAHGGEAPRLNAIAMLLVMLGVAATLRGPNNVKTAWRDLLSGDARQFDRESTRRYELIQTSAAEDVTVPALKTRPKSLYFNDFKPDPNDWRNTGAASFFGKKVIRLESQP